jgi:hypothetical protein
MGEGKNRFGVAGVGDDWWGGGTMGGGAGW